ncbi:MULTISPECIES: M24 family metallopeptidase [unclassified Yoonia]|uniref:M24 family metallopeptidase n=1 Tax=unclassified Yoonia TaxID=2629118 RepID=UPI002AFE4A94|nr:MULTISPECIES: M24 family metallopeptidase [unclassified Yoonia]
MTQTLRQNDPGLYQRRRDALVAELGRPVLVFGMGSALGAGSKSHGALRYLTGWDGHESASLLVLTQTGARLICASPFMVPLAAETLPELDPVYLPPDRWAGLIRDHIPAGTVELIGLDELPMGIARHLHPVIREDDTASAVLDRMRVIKEPAALELHRAGAAICDAIFARLPSVLTVGASVADAQRDLESFAVSQGADACRMWLTIRPQADRPRYWPEETQGFVGAGDQVLVGIALTVDGHWAHGIRMGAVGQMRPDHARLLDIVAVCLRAGLDHARPGLPLTDLVDAMEDTFRAGTLSLDRHDLQRFRFGHGLGMSYEDPILTDAFVQSFGVKAPAKRPDGAGGILAPGMVLELHPNLFLPGVGGAALGEMVIIGETGAETPITTPLTPILFGSDY